MIQSFEHHICIERQQVVGFACQPICIWNPRFMDHLCTDSAIEQLYKAHAAQLRNYLYYRCKDFERSNDLVQDAFSKLWEKCKDIVPEAAKSFLYTVARNAMINLSKKDQVRMEFAVQQEHSLDYETPQFDMEFAEYKTKLESAITSLPDGQREVFLMNRIDKLTYREIAERLEISQKAVEKRMHNALVKLREALTETAHLI
ncbi:MAG: sigma-70 family RNA polymerase sigma factor [Bacteroidota bacterium]